MRVARSEVLAHSPVDDLSLREVAPVPVLVAEAAAELMVDARQAKQEAE
jgi:hypothetical protein